MLDRIPPLLAAALIAFLNSPVAWGASTMLFNANQPYLGIAGSPLQAGGGTFVLENFENGSINSLVTAVGGAIKGPSANTDSVDGDDGSINGQGNGGHSYRTGGKSITFHFAAQGGERPSMAGLVWTDGKANSRVTFRAWDSAGNLLGKIRTTIGDASQQGTTAEDRFFGIESDEGIARITISSNRRGFEVDHVQFAYAFSVVPLPPAAWMGIAGLFGAAIWRRRALRGL